MQSPFTLLLSQASRYHLARQAHAGGAVELDDRRGTPAASRYTVHSESQPHAESHNASCRKTLDVPTVSAPAVVPLAACH